MYTISDIIIIGSKEVVRQEANFNKVTLFCWNGEGAHRAKPYEIKFFGLYRMFTIETQRTYGTEDELLFILGAMKILQDNNIKLSLPTNNIKNKSTNETIKNMKYISEQYGVDIKGDSFDEIYDEMKKSDWFDIDNYFYWYRDGKCDYLNLIRILKENKLLIIEEE